MRHMEKDCLVLRNVVLAIALLACCLALAACSALPPSSRPLVVGIADICPEDLPERLESTTVRLRYARAVYASGNVPFAVPVTTNRAEVARALDCLDVLVLSGGEDVDPALYGAPRSAKCGSPNRLRDAWERMLLDEAVRRRMPVVGTCRGMQIANVYFGGTLYQDLPSERPGAIAHNSSSPHPVSIEPDSRLGAILAATNVAVNTYHHQAVKDVAPGFRVVARSPDGVIEAMESETLPVALVQFHPEAMAVHQGDRRMLRLFERILSWAGSR